MCSAWEQCSLTCISVVCLDSETNLLRTWGDRLCRRDCLFHSDIIFVSTSRPRRCAPASSESLINSHDRLQDCARLFFFSLLFKLKNIFFFILKAKNLIAFLLLKIPEEKERLHRSDLANGENVEGTGRPWLALVHRPHLCWYIISYMYIYLEIRWSIKLVSVSGAFRLSDSVRRRIHLPFPVSRKKIDICIYYTCQKESFVYTKLNSKKTKERRNTKSKRKAT